MTDGMTALDLAEDLGMLQPDDVEHVVVEYLGLDLHDEDDPGRGVRRGAGRAEPGRGTCRTSPAVLGARASAVVGWLVADSW